MTPATLADIRHQLKDFIPAEQGRIETLGKWIDALRIEEQTEREEAVKQHLVHANREYQLALEGLGEIWGDEQ